MSGLGDGGRRKEKGGRGERGFVVRPFDWLMHVVAADFKQADNTVRRVCVRGLCYFQRFKERRETGGRAVPRDDFLGEIPDQ